jgi:hypothetical protein
MDELRTAFPLLSKPQLKVLALYSMGMVLAGRCGLSCVAFALSAWLGQKFQTVRERLRDWYCSAADKSGRRRRDLPVPACFAPLLAWILKDWTGLRLAIALDATSLSSRFTVLAVSVLYRSAAIPVAWLVLPANARGRWKPKWLQLLEQFKAIVPDRFEVIVLADRGLYAQWLFQAIVKLAWHPLLRVNTHNAVFRPEGGRCRSMAGLLAGPGSSYVAAGVAFRSAKARLPCTLLACWVEGCAEGWFLLSDLPPQKAAPVWYGLRGWIERGFKLTKSGGWNWQETRMTDPQRAQRQWLAMSVASVYVLRQATTQEKRQEPQNSPARKTAARSRKPEAQPKRPRRILSVFRAGLILLPILLLSGALSPHQRFIPEPWPDSAASLFASTQPQDRPP